MRLLILTQAVDSNDTTLGFFHGWLREFSKRFDSIQVICLKEGKHDLPKNVTVHSLGKETGPSRLKYIYWFYRYIWSLRKEYDAVLVHMNQEYVLLGWKTWLLLGKRVYLWRNHYQGGIGTSVASVLCTKVFFTSKFSYTARYSNAVQMPVGIDLSLFKQPEAASRTARSVLSLGRISPSKHIDILIGALRSASERGVDFTAAIYGDALPQDAAYEKSLHTLVAKAGIEKKVSFHSGIPNTEAPEVYARHELFVNMSQSGMYDKTIFEAAASGCIVLTCSRDFAERAPAQLIFKENDANDLAVKLIALLEASPDEHEQLSLKMRELASSQSLETLGRSLAQELA